ncbi:23S rRNA (adenine(2030)-N(6))-methyltransferase RlmJ [Thalassospira sp. MCCC 1A01428]|uniref:23S rRNA (adenine(2030)-N(6))-methyltransferase RlmJ n=1 Tax=Thalassospira sp. MCCC 1A01428 TaxID=1470575 RepID=UPI000A1FBF79|nr:23S rRNA (adenine(2030)-N(6))-methyltransferase RlmJ [Thalassospira sp. MCCC 1A01428]OSQ44977.1 DNA utilization protein YhiR [Thalassospira sp. MCCC 1A01428]
MLSYLHGFHAGNFADVHKHSALVLILAHLQKKTKPFCVIDTHAGAGWYDLSSLQAQKTGEWKGGIAAVQYENQVPVAMVPYLDLIEDFIPENRGFSGDSGAEGDVGPDGDTYQEPPLYYPGSPFIVQKMLRENDHLAMMELHPREYETLDRRIYHDRRVTLQKRDGYEGLVAMVPPAIRRGLVLMDPSYDVKQDYARAARSIIAAHRRWATATYMLWYPILEDGFDHELHAMFREIPAAGGVLCSEIAASHGGGKGRMLGSGLLIVNPPYQLDEQLADIGEWLRDVVHLPGPGVHFQDWLVKAQ